MIGTGRSPEGRLRNFKAMGEDKLWKTYGAVVAEGDDPEALAALQAEMERRGIDVPEAGDGPEAELAALTGEEDF